MINGELIDSASLGGVLDVRDPYAYEVVRLIDGRPLFLREHYARLEKTLRMLGHDIPLSEDSFRSMMLRLADACGIQNDNAKLMLNGWDENGRCSIYLTYLGAVYPDQLMYRDGVRTGLIHAMRHNPQAKVGNRPLRLRTNEFIRDRHLFEAILVDANGDITEGSRSNIFFVRSGEVYTSPSSGVLLGVTRQKLFSICKSAGIPIHEETIPEDRIGLFDSAFISGTSPKVLPIRAIDQIRYDVGEATLRKLMKLYDKAIEEDLNR